MLEMFHDPPNSNTLLDDRAITDGWQAYKQVNRAFRDKVSIPYRTIPCHTAAAFCWSRDVFGDVVADLVWVERLGTPSKQVVRALRGRVSMGASHGGNQTGILA